MSLLEGMIDSGNNPLAVVEDIAADNNWAFERSGEDEVTIVSKGDWTDYQLSFTWMPEIEALHLASAFDMKISPQRAIIFLRRPHPRRSSKAHPRPPHPTARFVTIANRPSCRVRWADSNH